MNWRQTLAVLVGFTLGACNTEPPTSLDEAPGPEASFIHMGDRAAEVGWAALAAAEAGDRSRGFESDILRLEGQAPGLGGIYYDPKEGGIVALMSPEADASRVMAVVEAFFATRSILAGENGLVRSPRIQIRRADYAFSQLIGWTEVLLSQVRETPAFVSIGADEELNRVRIGLSDLESAEAVEAILAQAGAPREAVVFEHQLELEPLIAPAAPAHTLRDRVRATGAGIQIRNGLARRCTHGWTVRDAFGGS